MQRHKDDAMVDALDLNHSHLKRSRCGRHAFAIDLPAASVLARRRCLAGKHVVFVSNAALASGVMRGELPRSVLHQTLQLHGVRATLCGPPCNATRLDGHLTVHGPADVCVMIKYADPLTHRYCRKHGALTILDNVDNHRAFDTCVLAARAVARP